MKLNISRAFKQLLLSNSNKCGVCDAKLKNKVRKVDVCLYNSEFTEYTIAKAELVECYNCYCLNAVKGKTVFYSADRSLKAYFFNYGERKLFPYEINSRRGDYSCKIACFPCEHTPLFIPLYKKFAVFFEKHKQTLYVSDLYSIKLDKLSESSSDDYLQCPVCKKMLAHTHMSLYTKDNEFFKVSGNSCGEHFFIKKFGRRFKNLTDNGELILNTSYNMGIAKNYALGDRTPLIILLSNTVNRIIVVVGSEEKITESYIMIDYKKRQTRKFLAEIIHDKAASIEFDGNVYDCVKTSTIETVFPREIDIKRNGGIEAAEDEELVDVLLYVKNTETYEIARCSYSKKGKYFFMDKTRYNSFVKYYGVPEIPVYGAEGNGTVFDGFSEESLLKSYGYSVGEKEGLSKEKRQTILKNLVDSHKMTKEEIVEHLSRCIDLRKNQTKYENACSKWMMDIKFISDYNVNVSKFVLSE